MCPKSTLPKLTAKAPENRPGHKRNILFQPSIFRCKLLVSGRVFGFLIQHDNMKSINTKIHEASTPKDTVNEKTQE